MGVSGFSDCIYNFWQFKLKNNNLEQTACKPPNTPDILMREVYLKSFDVKGAAYT